MSNDQAVFSFELNESLYFEKGQEVEEMRGVSLDPEISIQPFHDYISIKGVMKLRGEYVKVDEAGTEQEQEDKPELADDHHEKRFVEQVTDEEDGEAVFSHRFPIEITVPSYRVENLDEVMVSIDSFDYELSEDRELAFTSTIAIHGIKEQNENSDEDTTDTTKPFIQEDDQTFAFDIKDPQKKQEEETPETPASVEHQDMPALTDETETSDEASSPDRWKHKKSQSLNEFLHQEPESKPEPEKSESLSSYSDTSDAKQSQVDSKEDTYSTDSVHTNDNWESSSSLSGGDPYWESPSDTDYEWENSYSSPSSPSGPRPEDVEDASVVADNKGSLVSPQINENSNENTETEKNEMTDVRYLSDMFRDETEHFSRMRVCIVQEKDTLELIADRYDISTLNLINQNHLEDDTISEGQLLYIPEKKSK